MGFKLSNTVQSLNDAMFPGPNKANNNMLSAFGGETVGFSRGVAEGYSKQFYTESAVALGDSVAKGMGEQPIRASIANKYALFNFQGFHGDLATAQGENYIDSANNPLMGGADAKNVSITKIINYFGDKYPKIGYQPSDFLYGKYYKQIPVNHLITLRRFPTPVVDNIYNYNVKAPDGGDANSVDATHIAGVTAVTYLGDTAGNKLSDLLKFSFGVNWTEVKSKLEEIDTSGTGSGGYTEQPFYNKIGAIGQAGADALAGVSASQKYRAQKGSGSKTGDTMGTTYANFVLGPINVIDKTMSRDRGLSFKNDFTLTFDYELKSLSYVNPKIAMIDIISNMLTMSTNNAQFWGGGHRYYGAAGYVAQAFGDPNLLRQGDFGGYMGSVVSSVQTGFQNLFGNAEGGLDVSSIGKGLLKTLGTAGMNKLGEMLGDQVGGQTGTQAAGALVSGDPTGNWHVTIGNPLNPIVMMGNMICDDTTMTLGEGLGYDDFPMAVKFEVSLKHGKPRDKGDIENMFNGGNGRIYASAEGIGDILNLAGLDVKVSGAVQNVGLDGLENSPGGSSGGSKQTNAAPANSIADSDVFKEVMNDITRVSNGGTVDVGDEYISNLTRMMIDS